MGNTAVKHSVPTYLDSNYGLSSYVSYTKEIAVNTLKRKKEKSIMLGMNFSQNRNMEYQELP